MRIQWSDLKTFDIIGSGSFGRVFHGDLLGTEVAIKECVRSNSKAFDEKYFKREVDILRQSRHPNIVQFMGICKRKKRFYIITEFLPLGNLRRWIQDETKEFGWDTRVSFAIDISLALAYLHHKNIIHRDLKGENLLISENMRIKVCDFGFSRVEAKDDDEMRRISYCGTDGYMAPEILLGEDFDCSVDVFSFGIVLAEMMARHVVDPQHFQRQASDMCVSADEILFRAQAGCPVELGELAIHCVQPLPQNRPNLRQIVERLTTIENVDIHVGTTLVVAPSVARAARNMMRKKETAARRLQEQEQYGPGIIGLHQETTSSIQGEAESWRMTNVDNASSRTTESHIAGSQSTYRGQYWKRGGSRIRGFEISSSAIPLVLVERFQETDQNNGGNAHATAESSDSVGDGGEDENVFRMPRWDSINSPSNLKQLRQWHESNPNGSSGGVDDREILQSCDQQRQQGESKLDLSQLSRIQVDLNDDNDADDDDGDSNCSFDSGESGEEDLDSFFGESSDLGTESRTYELSISSATTTTTTTTTAIPQSDEDGTKVFRRPHLISRLLPPIPTSENPWTSPLKILAKVTTIDPATERNDNGTAVNGQRESDISTEALVTHPVQHTVVSAAETAAEESLEATQESSTPPEPPSKSSLLLRTNTIKSNQLLSLSTTDAASPVDKEPVPITTEDPPNALPVVTTISSPLSAADSVSTSTTSSEMFPSSVSSSSSTEESQVKTEQESQVINGDNKNNGFTPHRGLTRGMSDSALEPTSNTVESGNTLTGNLIAAMGAKTWTGGTGGFGYWIGQYRHHGDQPDKTGLKKHTSLKEGKQQRQLIKGLVSEELEETTKDSEGAAGVKKSDPIEPMATVKKRAPKPLTGFPHRFSLVVFSTQLLPKCDVCQKRLGVLPGWSAKHLECDDCGYRTHPKCVTNVTKCCTSARKSGVWEIPV
ncbi:hypothetical protein BGZ65_002364 [Modicella reniformis]|uniref:Uncharacterized protein n=1 Tax=Modicella reniformis TaxID=1440133 RepID=A0A9P6M9R3_9FUNG|nr:hypothetical protein BGZ65_002364 [Modicella reniformis]